MNETPNFDSWDAEHTIPREYDAWCANHIPQTGPLFVLPPEVLSLVFAQLHQLPHVISFAIACKYLMSVGKNEVLRAMREFHAPWAGCRLICFGTAMLPDDIPEGMLSGREREDMRKWLVEYYKGMFSACVFSCDGLEKGQIPNDGHR